MTRDPGFYGVPFLLPNWPGEASQDVSRLCALPYTSKGLEVILLANEKKVEMVQELQEDLQRSKALLLADYRGLRVSEVSALRRKLREVDAEFKVVKNTLFERAMVEGGESVLGQMLTGPTAITFVHGDPIGPAKALVDFTREHKALSIKGGYVEGTVYSAEQVQALSKVPPREVLIAQMLGSMQSPLSGLVGTLQGVISSLVYTLQSVADKKAA